MATPMNSRLLVLFLVVTMVGCATQRSTQPRISASPRTGISLETPVLVSVLDARSVDDKSGDAAAMLASDLKAVYGKSIELVDYFAEVPEGRVALRMRLKANKATFGSRIISVSTIEQTYSTAQAEASSSWSSVVVTASETQTMLGSSVATEGWWIGTSWVELQVVDHRGGERRQFELPIVAEKKRSNTMGYRTASKVTGEAWGRVEQQLVQVVDEVLMALRSQQT